MFICPYCGGDGKTNKSLRFNKNAKRHYCCLKWKNDPKRRFKENIRLHKATGCWEWIGDRIGPEGYGRLRIGGKIVLAHVYSFVSEYGPLEPGMIVRHTCDNKWCVNPAHLLSGTRKDNAQDAVERNRFNPMKGKQHYAARYEVADIIAMREEYATGQISAKDLAAKYGGSKATILQIVNGKTWTTVGGPIGVPEGIAMLKGRHKDPNAASRAKLTEAQVLELRGLYDTGGYNAAKPKADEYGVNRQTLWQIATRKTWKHI